MTDRGVAKTRELAVTKKNNYSLSILLIENVAKAAKLF